MMINFKGTISRIGEKSDWMLKFNLNWAVIALIVLVLTPLSVVGRGRKR